MGKTIIGAIVGAVILFVWQFLSWTMFNVHQSEMQYTPNQDKIMAALNENLETGTYFIPALPPGASKEEMEALHSDVIGKPWAQINYHSAYDMSMGMNMFRAFLVNLLAMLILIWFLTKIPHLNFKTALLGSLGVGAIGYLTFPYLNSIWFDDNTMGYIIDTVVQWGLVGTWLGWWLTRDAQVAESPIGTVD